MFGRTMSSAGNFHAVRTLNPPRASRSVADRWEDLDPCNDPTNRGPLPPTLHGLSRPTARDKYRRPPKTRGLLPCGLCHQQLPFAPIA